MASLKDVAKLAGVSASTVSYVFNGKKTVRPAVEKRIYDAIDELGYHPNYAARSLKMKQTRSVGIVVADFSNIFYVDVLSGIERRVAKGKHSAIVCNSRNSDEIEMENLRNLVERDIDGIVLLGTGHSTTETIASLTVPVVSVDRIPLTLTTTVSIDDVKGGYLGTRHLLERGLTNITFIGFNDQMSSLARRQGCLNAYAEAGVDPNGHFEYVEIDISPVAGYELARQIAGPRNGSRVVEAIFATDYVAFGVLKALADLGLDVPGDVAVVGYDDLLLSQFTTPALTTIRQPAVQMGEQAADMLLRLLAHEPVEERLQLQPSLIVRDSA